MNLIYLKKFNNYYNRRLKYYDDIIAYLENSEEYYYNVSVDFNPNDGVTTTKTMNLDDPSFLYDYCLVQDEVSKSIVSRWFVIEAKRQRNGQYSIVLRRDVLADNFNSIIKSPIYIHKAKLSVDNPLIYNKENITVNQIKKSETLLKDETNSAWIVGYLANGVITAETVNDFSSVAEARENLTLEELDLQFNDIDDPTKGATANVLGDVYFEATGGFTNHTARLLMMTTYSNGNLVGNANVINNPGQVRVNVYRSFGSYDTNVANRMASAWANSFAFYTGAINPAIRNHMLGFNRPMMDNSTYLELAQINRPIYSTKRNKYYQVNIASNTQEYSRDYVDADNPQPYDNALSSLYEAVANKSKEYLEGTSVQVTANASYNIAYYYRKLQLNIVEVETPDDILQVSLSPSHKTTIDSPYDIFCMRFTESNLNLATSMQRQLTSAKLYDIQILPYCPVREIINDIAFGEENVDYAPITKEVEGVETTVDYLYWVALSQFKLVIPFNLNVNLFDPIEFKIINDCEMYRLVSPNFNGTFEFNIAKNKGLSGFNVACTYKPYTPFIYVAPIFGGLYGEDFYDARGLICQGNFSITQLSDAWQNYEIQNKNYMNIFNTQIKTMDANRNLMLGSEITSTALNSIASGIGTGMSTGNVWAGIAAGAASGIGGAVDIAIGQSMFQNNRQQSIDIFKMNLQNIKARPDSLTFVSAYNIINKYFPFIEYYSCTDEEKEAYRNKIKYEGMTVNAIGKIEDFINTNEPYNYIKGSLILLEDVADDYHTADTIAVELEKGVYL